MAKDTSSKILNVLDLFSSTPHRDDVEYIEEMRTCKTESEIIACVEKHGFVRADQNNFSAKCSQNK